MSATNKYGELECDACPKCGDPIKPHWKACPNCACGLVPECLNCGAPMKVGWKACPECGALVVSGRFKADTDVRKPFDVQKRFFDALVNNDLVAAQEMLDKGAKVDGARESESELSPSEASHGTTALWCACVGGEYEQAIWLLDRGANPNHIYFTGESILMTVSGCTVNAAKKKACLQIMDELIARGADVNYRNGRLYVIELAGSPEAQHLLKRHGAKGRAIHIEV